jgi:hypothetical protein
MSTKILDFDSANMWVHAYMVEDLLNVGPLPKTDLFFDVNGKHYVRSVDNNGKVRLTANGSDPNLTNRLATVLDNIEGELDKRLARQLLDDVERASRKTLAVAELNTVRNAQGGLEPRFDALWNNQFGHPFPPPDPHDFNNFAETRGGWLHMLFCH